jgi:hypothetical protein
MLKTEYTPRAFGYPVLEDVELDVWRKRYLELAQQGAVDSEGGTDWAPTLALTVFAKLGVWPDDERFVFVREAIKYAQYVGHADGNDETLERLLDIH